MMKKIIIVFLLSVLWMFILLMFAQYSLDKYSVFLIYLGWISNSVYIFLTKEIE